MKVVFIGASHFGLKCLKKIIESDSCTIVGAVTAPQKFSISYSKSKVKNILHADVFSICQDHDIPCTTMNNSMSDPNLFEKVKSWKPDMFIVSGWYHMVPKMWRDLAPTYGLHASLLPDYSGGAPLVWAIINGEKTTGISLFQFDDGVDNGPLIAQEKTNIENEDTIKTLYDRIEILGLKLLEDNLPRLANGTAKLTIQDESRRRLCPQRCPDDGIIDWSWPAERIYNFVRAQTKPYPGAFTVQSNKKTTIWSCLVADKNVTNINNGEFITEDGTLFIACGNDTAIQVIESSTE